MKLYQVRAMALNEFRMHWRGRGLVVLVLAILVLNIFGTLLYQSNADLMPGDTVSISTQVLALSWITISVTLIFILPVILSDTIPKDTQMGTGELLHALPLSNSTYLLGKLVGVWVSTLVGLFVVMGITAVLWLVLIQQVNWRLLLEICLLGMTALVLINGSLGVLVTVSQPTRRRAVLLAIGLFFALPIVLGIGNSVSVFYYFNPARLPIIMYYSYSPAPQPQYTFNGVLLSIGSGVLEVIVVWLGAWWYLRNREERA